MRSRRRRDMTVVPVSREEVQRAPGTFGDALRSIQNLPGVARAPFLSGSLIVRGSNAADTLVLVDGTFLPSAFHFGGVSSTIATEMLDRLDFYPGNFSARFGRATGGVVDIGLRAPIRTGSRTVVHLGVIDAGAFTEAALSPTLSVAASGRFGWLGYITGPFIGLATGTHDFVGFWDYQLTVDWHPSTRDRVRVSAYGDGDSFGFRDAGGTSTIGIGLGYHLAQAQWTHRFSASAELVTAFSTGWNGLHVSNTDVGPDGAVAQGTTVTLNGVPVHVRSELTVQQSRRARLHFGFDGLFGWRSYTTHVPPDDAMPDVPIADHVVNLALAQPAVYAEAELSPLPTLHLRPGLRLDVLHGTPIVSPRFNMDWAAWRDGLLKLGAGLFAQPPLDERVSIAPELIFVADSIARSSIGEVRPERAIHLSVGAEHRFSPWITLSVEGFYKSIWDALVGFPSLDLAMAGEAVFAGNQLRNDGQGRAYGVEVLLRHRQGARFFGWISYTLMRAERRDGADAVWRPFEFDQTHILTAVASVRLGGGWEVGGRFRYVTGRPTGYDRALFVGLTGGAASTSSEPWLDRVPDFHQLDLRVERQWTRPWGRISAFLEVLNVYNRLNPESVAWNADHTQYRATGLFLPIVPNLGVRGEL